MSIQKVALRHKKRLTKCNKDTIMCHKDTESEVNNMKKPEINLTGNTLENIIMMAPHLREIDQAKALYLMIGLYGGTEVCKETQDKKVG